MQTSLQQLVLHIGRHKTGTTALQYNFVRNLEALEKSGIFYPETGRDWVAHHKIADRVASLTDPASDPEDDALLARLLDELRNCGKDTVLISSEGFQRCNPTIVREVFKEFDVTVTVYIRDQLSYLQSSYLQAIHAENFYGTIEDYEERIFSCDYLEFLTAWNKAFSPEKMIVRVFSKEFLESGDVIIDFFKAVLHQNLGLEVDFEWEMLEPAARNTSLRGEALAFKKRLNAVLDNGHYYFAELYKALGLYSASIGAPVNLVSKQLSRKLKKNYRKSNRVILKKLSLPPSLLDFEQVETHQVIPWIGAIEFQDVLLKLIEMDERCNILLNDCYGVEVQLIDRGWRLDFCRNICMDSMPYVRIQRGATSLLLDEIGSFESDSYVVPCNRFDPHHDQLWLDFGSGKKVIIQKNMKI